MSAMKSTPLLGLLLLAGVLPAAAQGMRPGTVFKDCAACPKMVVVAAGSFVMGSPSSEEGRSDDEGPQHRVTIGSPFAVGVYEVTFTEWGVCVNAGGCGGYRPGDQRWGRGPRPVINVSWEDAQLYLDWLRLETGERYRLLSEAEWEYMARAGTSTPRYWGETEVGQCGRGNGADLDLAGRYRGRLPEGYAWVRCSDGHVETAPVGSFQPNAGGLYDVLGNVWEWTNDCWNESYSGAPTDGGAWRSGDCSLRVLRGGSWYDDPWLLRSANRGSYSVGGRIYRAGFRVARTVN